MEILVNHINCRVIKRFWPVFLTDKYWQPSCQFFPVLLRDYFLQCRIILGKAKFKFDRGQHSEIQKSKNKVLQEGISELSNYSALSYKAATFFFIRYLLLKMFTSIMPNILLKETFYNFFNISDKKTLHENIFTRKKKRSKIRSNNRKILHQIKKVK